MPPLHIKLGLMKQFVKALDQNCEAFELSEAKIKKPSIFLDDK